MPSPALRRWLAAVLVPILVPAPLAGAGASLAAAPDPTMALLVVPAPDLSPRVGQSVREAIARRGLGAGLRLLPGAERPPVSRADVEALRAGLAAGRAAYEALDPDLARTRLELVTAALEGDPRLAVVAPDLLDAPVLLAVVALGLGDTESGEAALARALRLAPHLALPPARFAPNVEHALATTRVRLTALRPSRLRLGATPPGIDLFVDGVHRGRTPLAFEPLAPGSHLLVGQAPTGTPVTLTVEANEFGPDVVEVAVPAGAAAPSLVAIARSLSAADARIDLPPGPAGAMAEVLGAGRLVLVWVEGTPSGLAAAAVLLDLTAGETIALLDLDESPDPARAGERIGDWVAAAARGEAPRPRPRLLPDWRMAATPGAPAEVLAPSVEPTASASDPDAADRPWYRRWYWWALIGVAVVGGAAAIAGSGGGGDGGTGSVTVTP